MLVAVKDNIRIQMDIRVHRVKVALLRVGRELDLLVVQHKHNEFVLVAHRDIIKIPIHIQVPLVKVV